MGGLIVCYLEAGFIAELAILSYLLLYYLTVWSDDVTPLKLSSETW